MSVRIILSSKNFAAWISPYSSEDVYDNAVDLQANKIEEGHYEIEGSPASCVNIALYNFASDCDFVVAGPNLGHNLGRCVH